MATPGNIQFMQTAIQLSEKAGILEKTGRCFGAVVVNGDQIVGQGYNQVIVTHTSAPAHKVYPLPQPRACCACGTSHAPDHLGSCMFHPCKCNMHPCIARTL